VVKVVKVVKVAKVVDVAKVVKVGVRFLSGVGKTAAQLTSQAVDGWSQPVKD